MRNVSHNLTLGWRRYRVAFMWLLAVVAGGLLVLVPVMYVQTRVAEAVSHARDAVAAVAPYASVLAKLGPNKPGLESPDQAAKHTPWDDAAFEAYRDLIAAGASVLKNVPRVLMVERAPGVQQAMVDVSARGTFTFIISHLAEAGVKLTPEQRVVLDVGANDGVQGSNSFNFAQLGWRAVLVEPQSVPREEARRNVFGMMEDHNLNVVVLPAAAVAADDRDRQGKMCVSGKYRTSSYVADEAATAEAHAGQGDGDCKYGYYQDVELLSVPTLVSRVNAAFLDMNFGTRHWPDILKSKRLRSWRGAGRMPGYLTPERALPCVARVGGA